MEKRKPIKEIARDRNNLINREVMKKYFPVAILFFAAYILVSFFILKDYAGALILSATLLLAFLAMIIFVRTNNLRLATHILAFIGIPTLLPWLMNGGPGGVGFWWSIVYAVWAFFVADKKIAIFWLSIHFCLASVIVILSQAGKMTIAYSIPEIINMTFAFFITIVLVFLFNKVREYYYQLSLQQASKLSEVNDGLVSANNELKQFVNVSTHFLQEPLRTISNFAGLIEEKYAGKTDTETDEYLNYILTSTDKLQELIKDLMNFTRIEKDKEFEPVDCNEVLREVKGEMQTIITETRTTIISDNLPVVLGDRMMLKQLLTNAIDNSIKFRKKNVPPAIFINVHENEYEFEFEVKDNGIGIEEQYLGKLFNIFQRLNSAEEYQGTGIGLAMAKKIVSIHKGRIWMESKPGEGCTLHFAFPKEMKNKNKNHKL